MCLTLHRLVCFRFYVTTRWARVFFSCSSPRFGMIWPSSCMCIFSSCVFSVTFCWLVPRGDLFVSLGPVWGWVFFQSVACDWFIVGPIVFVAVVLT